MKRSTVNEYLKTAKKFFWMNDFHLPPWAFWSPTDWNWNGMKDSEVVRNSLGWDLTDFGSGNFEKRGLLLFTIRNGNPKYDKKVYAEKIMIVQENQETPMHFHWLKTEDIINRCGGILCIELFSSDKSENLIKEDFNVSIDGIAYTYPAGTTVELKPGESICLTPGLYHRFYAKPGFGPVMVGEVSSVNNDVNDNRFHESIGRFPQIIEDEPPLHHLVSDYPVLLQRK